MQLHRWGLLDAVVAAGTPAVRTTTFRYAADEVTVPIKPAHGVDALYAPRRTVLDPILVDAARAAGATFRYGVTVTDVHRDQNGRVDGISGRDQRGRVALAGRVGGRRGRHPRRVWRPRSTRPSRSRGRAPRRSRTATGPGSPATGTSGSSGRDACAGVIPTNDGRSCVFAGASPARIGRGGLDIFHEVVRAASPALAERLADAIGPAGVRTFGGLPGYLRRPYGRGWALVGDAGYWKDPISAHGLTDALRDAELLARALVAAATGAEIESEALGEYHATRDRLSMPLFTVTDTIAGMRWTDAEIPRLLYRLSEAMNDEMDAIDRLDQQPALTLGGPA